MSNTTRKQWLELAERCEKATGPDREIDALIWLAVGDIKMRFSKISGGWAFFDPPFEPGRIACLSGVKGSEADAIKVLAEYDFLPRPTASLDAITALIERELPSGTKGVYLYWPSAPRVAHRAVVSVPLQRQFGVDGKTAALALCAAFCRAMAEKADAP